MIILFTLVNKASGIYFLITFDFLDVAAIARSIYTVIVEGIFIYGFTKGILKDRLVPSRLLTNVYLLDTIITVIFTLYFFTTWINTVNPRGMEEDGSALVQLRQGLVAAEDTAGQIAEQWAVTGSVAFGISWHMYCAYVIYAYHHFQRRNTTLLPLAHPFQKLAGLEAEA